MLSHIGPSVLVAHCLANSELCTSTPNGVNMPVYTL